MNKLRIYVNEIEGQIKYAKRCFLDFEVSLEKNDIHSVFFHLHHFTVHVANVDKLLSSKPNSNRARIYGNHINLNEINFKPFRKLRDLLEHFDERLDRWVEKCDGHVFFDNNIITGGKGFPDKGFLRALDGYTYKFNSENFELKPLIQTLNSLENILNSIAYDS